MGAKMTAGDVRESIMRHMKADPRIGQLTTKERCWLWHDYAKWKEHGTGKQNFYNSIDKREYSCPATFIRRTCKTCGFIQDKTIVSKCK